MPVGMIIWVHQFDWQIGSGDVNFDAAAKFTS